MEPFTDTLPDGMPEAAALIAELRAADPADRAAIIARYPVLELLAPAPVLADWLGMRVRSIWVARGRTRPDGSKEWPDEDDTLLGRSVWRFSTIALHRATTPGRGWNLRAEIKEGAK